MYYYKIVMIIIIGHVNTDLDCLGSITLAKYIYPDSVVIKSRLISPSAKKLFNLYDHFFNFIKLKDINIENIDKIVIVDTRNIERIKEFKNLILSFKGEIDIWDHHLKEKTTIPYTNLYSMQTGSNTTQLGLELIKRNIKISKEDATIALAGIYADTGNFSHPSTTKEDFYVASYLLQNNASINIISKLNTAFQNITQKSLFHKIMNNLSYRIYHGHFIIISYYELEKQNGGLANIIEKIHEIENPDATFGIFYLKKENNTLLIARSQKETIDLQKIMFEFGGGGHTLAASAYIKKTNGIRVRKKLEKILEQKILPAITAKDIMVKNPDCISINWTLKKASMFLEQVNHTGAPVLDDKENLVGFLTLRDIMKGRKANQMNAPVSAYMRKKVISASADITIRTIERIFYLNNIGHLPIVENEKVIGIITRSDLIKYFEKKDKETETIKQNTASLKEDT